MFLFKLTQKFDLTESQILLGFKCAILSGLCCYSVVSGVLPWLLDVLTVDRAVENIGFGWFQVKLSLFTGLVWVCDLLSFSFNDDCRTIV